MKRHTIAALFLALVAAACGGADDGDTTSTTGAPGTTSAPDGPARMMLVVSNEGGFMPIEMMLNRPPTYTLLTDGTLIFEGATPAIFPGPVLPKMQQVTLTDDQMRDVEVLIEATGLPDVVDYVNNDAMNFVADAGTTVATYVDDAGSTHRMSVYALGIEPDMPDDLANLSLLWERLGDIAHGSLDAVPYIGDELIVRVMEGGSFGAEFDDVRPWPFDFEPGEPTVRVADIPCEVLTGDAAAAARALLAEATQATQWEHESGTFAVLGRDLLPGESGCEPQ